MAKQWRVEATGEMKKLVQSNQMAIDSITGPAQQ
jgi:hypothetical protein